MSHISSPRLSRRTGWLGVSGLVVVLAALLTATLSVAVDSSVTARFVTSRGWVKPDETYTFSVKYVATSAPSAALTLALPASAYFVSSVPSPSASTAHSATYNGLAGNAGEIVVSARAASTTQDPEVVWKNISATAQLVAGGTTLTSTTNGPYVTEIESAILGDRPFPVVNVQYADVGHCVGAGDPLPECTRDHPVTELDAVLNSRDPARPSLWQHYNDMSLGKLNVQGTAAALGKDTVPFTGIGQHKFSQIAPSGACSGTTRSAPGADGEGSGGTDGTPTYPNRIEDGWYVLPGTQGYYGADKYGHGLGGAVTGVGAIFGIDDACGPTGKMAYDAASVADPDIDYNDFDSDRDGLVDFFEILFAGVGGNGSTDPSGVNNVWPHSSSLEFYFTDVNGEKGYVSSDQRRDAQQRPLWWIDASRRTLTTTDNGETLKAYVRVGRYNVNPETAFDKSSVLSHEYGHSLGLPDFYSLGTRSTFGTWELMAEDHSQYMTGYARQKLGWIVPRLLTDGQVTLRESKYDTHSIVWRRPDGTEYELSGPDVHNVDLYKVKMANPPLIDDVPDGVRAMFSGAGNDFGCPTDKGHGMVVALPDLKDHGDATAATLKFKTKYEIEWDYDYGFVLVSTNGGQSWTSLSSKNGTTLPGSSFNPNGNGCQAQYGNGITGVSGGANTPANPDRASGTYPTPLWIDDEYDLTAYKGQELLIAFSYATDPGLAKKGWFIDQLSITLAKAPGDVTLYASSFETDTRDVDELRVGALGLAGWNPLSTADGGTADHAYYVEMRDRIGWDFDGRGMDDRANGPSWQPGVLMVYTNEATGYGNTDGVNPPHQTPVDAAPQPGNESPVLDDAAFTLTRPDFDGCTHVDNYLDPNAADENWKLPDSLKFTVIDLTGLSSDGSIPGSPATATLLVDIFPDCSIVNLPPELSVGSDYENPDPDGLFTLDWTRPAGASGPDTLQQATVYSVLLEDDAEGGLTQWVTATSGTGAFEWEATPAKSRSGNAFWGRTANGADVAASGNKPATMLTSANAIAIPTDGSTTLSYWDFYMNEGDDTSVLEVSADDGATWKVLSNASRSELAPDAAPIIATEPLAYKEFSLDEFKGRDIRIQFRMQAGGDDRAGSSPFGWYVDDIRIETNNFADVQTLDVITSLLSRSTGTYYYRVRTAYPAGPVTVPSGWSNVEEVVVAPGVIGGGGGGGVIPPAPKGSGNNVLGGAFSPWALLGLLALGRRRVRESAALLTVLFTAFAGNAHALPERISEDAKDAVARLRANAGGELSHQARPVAGYTALRARGAKPLMADGAATSPTDRARMFLSVYGAAMEMDDPSGQVALQRVSRDTAGRTHVHLDQFHQGLPVFGARVVVHMNDAGITGVNGVFVRGLDGLSTRPTRDLAAVRAAALAYASKFHGPRELRIASGRWLVYPVGLTQGHLRESRLAYEASVVAANGRDVRERVFIDARTGAPLDRISEIHSVLNREIYTPDDSAAPVLVEGSPLAPSDPPLIADPGHGSTDASDPAPGQPTENLYVFAGGTYALYDNMFGRKGYDACDAGGPCQPDTPAPAWSPVRGDSFVGQLQKSIYLVNQNCPNAYWNGNATNYCPGFDADDVVSHEWSHAYTQYTSNLIYAYQSGALNESYSDIFGETYDLLNNLEGPLGALTLTEHEYYEDGGSRWVVGEDLSEEAAALLLRDMWKPDDFPATTPGKATSGNYVCGSGDGGGVHTNSSVPNHAYAMLVDGTAGQGPVGSTGVERDSYNGQQFNGIGMIKAAHVYFQAQANYQTPTTDFPQHAEALRASCQDLKGVNLKDQNGAASGQVITQGDCDVLDKAILATELDLGTLCPYLPVLRTGAPALCPGAQNLFTEDWESGDDGWARTSTGVFAEWEDASRPERDFVLDSTLPAGRAGTAAFARNIPIGEPGGGTCQPGGDYSGEFTIDSPDIAIPADANGLQVRFDHYVHTEATADGGQLEVAVNGGTYELVSQENYIFNFPNSALLGPTDLSNNPNGGEFAWNGSDVNAPSGSPPSNWGTTIVNLAAHAQPGDTVKLRFKFTQEGCNGIDGWYVDTVRVDSCPVFEAPVLTIEDDYEDPDTDGTFTLSWERPAGATGPDLVQTSEASCAPILADDAENGLALWDVTTEGDGVTAWSASTTKKHNGANAFFTNYQNGADAAQAGNVPVSILTLKDAVAIPVAGDTSLTYWDWFVHEGDDAVFVEVSIDDGATWAVLHQDSRFMGPEEAGPLLVSEPMTLRTLSLAAYEGQSIKVRFRFQSGGEDRPASTPFGWYVDDIAIVNDDWANLLTTPNSSHTLVGQADGDRCYRVQTTYMVSGTPHTSGFSNIEAVTVDADLPPVDPPLPDPELPGGNNRLGGALDPLTLLALALALLTLGRRRIRG